MNLLLDTHTLLWFLRDDPSLSATAKGLILDPANHKFVSVASCWEIAIKATRRRFRQVRQCLRKFAGSKQQDPHKPLVGQIVLVLFNEFSGQFEWLGEAGYRIWDQRDCLDRQFNVWFVGLIR